MESMRLSDKASEHQKNLKVWGHGDPEMFFTKLKTYHLSYYAVDVTDPRNMLDTCYNFVMGLAHHGCLCGSVEEHQSMEKSKGLRPWGPRNFSLFDTHDKTKNIFLNFFTELKNWPSFLFY